MKLLKQDLTQQIQQVLQNYNKLSYDEDTKTFQGILFVDDNDYYHIKIDITPFSANFPNVYEIGERIPQKADRHIYPRTKNCCFTTHTNENILLKTQIFTLDDFIKKIVIPYFQNNSYFELTNEYMFGEYSHNSIDALIETYCDILGVKDLYIVLNTIELKLNGIKLTQNDLCYCGSNLKLKKCKDHFEKYNNFKKIDNIMLFEDIQIILTPFFNMISREFQMFLSSMLNDMLNKIKKNIPVLPKNNLYIDCKKE